MLWDSYGVVQASLESNNGYYNLLGADSNNARIVYNMIVKNARQIFRGWNLAGIGLFCPDFRASASDNRGVLYL